MFEGVSEERCERNGVWKGIVLGRRDVCGIQYKAGEWMKRRRNKWLREEIRRGGR